LQFFSIKLFWIGKNDRPSVQASGVGLHNGEFFKNDMPNPVRLPPGEAWELKEQGIEWIHHAVVVSGAGDDWSAASVETGGLSDSLPITLQ
jgi:hypothetical protein